MIEEKIKKRSNSYFSLFLTYLSIVSLLLLLDNDIMKNKIFNNFSFIFREWLYSFFGIFYYPIVFTLLFLSLFFLLPILFSYKFSLSIGVALFISFLPPFCYTFKLTKNNSGYYAKTITHCLESTSNIVTILLYFSWLFLSLFFILLPLRKSIVNIITLFFKSQRSINSTFKQDTFNKRTTFEEKERVNSNNKERIAILSKVVYEDNNNRIEIPIIPKDEKLIKQFELIKKEENFEKYKEKIDNQILLLNKEDYYKKLKENWPKRWQEEENNKNINLLEDKSKIALLGNETNEEEFSLREDVSNNILIEKNDNINKDILTKQTDEYKLPESDILENSQNSDKINFVAEHKESAKILEETLKEFAIEAKVTDIITGPVVTLFKLIPAPGIKLQKIESLSNNLALRLAAKSIRIIAPIPGEKVVGIEIPNKTRQLVRFKEIVNSTEFNESNFEIPIGLGKDIHGKMIVIDLYKMPHLLIAGATGSGKSVCVNVIISSILFSKKPEEIRLLLIDPKIVELKPYNNIPHLLTPVISEPKLAIKALKYLMLEMEKRYALLDEVGARDIVEYKKRKKKLEYKSFEDIPFIVAIVDEFADLISTSGKEAEILFARLAAKARAVGIHLILATQRPSTDVITGLIKANIPARIAFQVISLLNSRIILDQKGAENLLGQGDMLYISPTQPFPIRIQGAFLSKDEVDTIAEHWKSISEPEYVNIEEIIKDEDENREDPFFESGDDPLFEEALKIVYQTHKASASYLQRRLSIGYNRAARIIEEMEKRGIIGPQNGAKPREIIKADPGLF